MSCPPISNILFTSFKYWSCLFGICTLFLVKKVIVGLFPMSTCSFNLQGKVKQLCKTQCPPFPPKVLC